MTWNFDTMKEALSEMEKVNYQEFIKAFLSLELSILIEQFSIKFIKIIWMKMTCP